MVTADVEPSDVAQLKGSSAMAEALEGLVRSRRAPADARFAVRVGQEWVRLTSVDVAAARQAAEASALAHNRARQVFKEHLIGMVTSTLERGTAEALAHIDAETADSTGLDLDAAARADLRTLGFDGAAAADPAEMFDAEALRTNLMSDAHAEGAVELLWPRLTPETVVTALLGDARALATHLPSLTDDERGRLLRPAGAPWADADVALLDEAASLVGGPPERTFGHVVVDEAQELTAAVTRSATTNSGASSAAARASTTPGRPCGRSARPARTAPRST